MDHADMRAQGLMLLNIAVIVDFSLVTSSQKPCLNFNCDGAQSRDDGFLVGHKKSPKDFFPMRSRRKLWSLPFGGYVTSRSTKSARNALSLALAGHSGSACHEQDDICQCAMHKKMEQTLLS